MTDASPAVDDANDAPRARVATVPKIAYLCSLYPAVSHTFILREVNALRRLGAQIATFSIRRASSDQLLAEADRAACASTYAILPPRWVTLLRTHLKLAVNSPAAYLSTLASAVRLAPGGLRGRLWQCFYFAESVVLWRECQARGIRHIHAHLANAAADIALLTSRLGSAIEPASPWSWSFTMHGPTEFSDVRHYRLAEKVARARFVVCISEYARSQLMALSDAVEWQKLRVVHVGLPIEQFTPRQHGPISDGDPRILCVGRLVPEKGQAVLLEAVALLGARGRGTQLTLVGEGPMRSQLEVMAQSLGIRARVSFPGTVGQEQIRERYASTSIFCLPSFAEGIPVVLMEAMAMALPVISTRITGIPELIDDGHSGLLVAPGRADQLADAIERLVGDPSLCREIGARARDRVLHEFNAELSASDLHGLFAEHVGGSSSAP